MHCITATRTGNPLAYFKTWHVSPDSLDGTGGGITQCERLVQAVEGSFSCGEQSLAAGFVQHTFRPGRDQGGCGFHQGSTWLGKWFGYFNNPGFAAAQILKDLFHHWMA